MDCLCEEMPKMLENETLEALPRNELESAAIYLLEQAYVDLKYNKLSDAALGKAQAVLDITWQSLNTGHWSKVAIPTRQLYTAAAFIKIQALLNSSLQVKRSVLQSALEAADLGIMLGAPIPESKYPLTKVAELLSAALQDLTVPANGKQDQLAESSRASGNENVIEYPGVKGLAIPVLQRPSLERFRAEYFITHKPVKLTGCINHWPALEKWKQLEYLKRVAGTRTVPVEIGAHYIHPEWGQKLMTLGDFIENHVLCNDSITGYLAQHPLFDQIPELRSDIREPEYCCLSENDDSSECETDINAWFGPAGTVSPLHHDPKHNLLAQVIGEKRVILYSPEDTLKLYPHEESMLNNTAQVNPESPDYVNFPNFENAKALECHLKAGEMLYIPPKWWHHVRSLATSFSVSFWWR